MEGRIITNLNPKSTVSEAYRILRTNIQFSSPDKKLKSILFTSAGMDEGKTTTVINLAITMAQAGNKVLVVDCDLRKPTIHSYVKLSNEKGLTTILAQNEDFRSIIKDIKIDNLDIIPSGPIPPNPAELLGSQRMEKFLETVKGFYDYILIDTPPVGFLTDAAVLSTKIDGVILVIPSGRVTIELANRVKHSLQRVKANIIGVVLNKMPVNRSSYYYSNYNNYYGRGETIGKK
jgi:capsular exopolysaccharide synthesis family protein